MLAGAHDQFIPRGTQMEYIDRHAPAPLEALLWVLAAPTAVVIVLPPVARPVALAALLLMLLYLTIVNLGTSLRGIGPVRLPRRDRRMVRDGACPTNTPDSPDRYAIIVSFPEAATAFDDEMAAYYPDALHEDRFILTGYSHRPRLPPRRGPAGRHPDHQRTAGDQP